MPEKRLKYVLQGEDQSAGKTLDKVGGKAEKTGGMLGRVGGGLKAGLVGIASSIAVGAIVDGFNDIVAGASDANETANKAKTIFGSSYREMDKWGKGAAKALGLSRQEALAAASGFGDMFMQIGFSRQNATQFSKDVVEMSADLGSFNNLPTADVSERIAAAFRGEYDSLQVLIPNINAARVEKEALAETGKKNAKSLTAEEKATATLSIIAKDGARAQGDFAKTSGDLANRQKIQAAQAQNLSDRFGKMLIPIKQLALDGFDKLMQMAEPVTEWLEKNPAVIDGAKEAFNGLMGVIEFLAKILGPVLQPILVGNIRLFVLVTETVANMLDALGNVPGFGWAKGAAESLRKVSAGAKAAADGIDAIGKEKVIVDTKAGEKNIATLKSKISSVKGKIVKAEAKGDTKAVDRLKAKLAALKKQYNVAINVRKTGVSTITAVAMQGGRGWKMRAYRSGGRPKVGEPAMFHKDELWMPDEAGTVLTAAQTKRALNGGPGAIGGGGDNVTIVVSGDTDPSGAARRIERILTARKKRKGRLDFQ